MTGVRRPPALRAGDRVSVVALSSPVPATRLDAGIAVLRGWGLDVVEGDHLRQADPDLPYLAGADRDRAADLSAAWLDPDVRAVLCARGGYGVPRMLDLVDWDVIGAVPGKHLVGFSDVTPLLHLLVLRLRVSAVHGPAVTGIGDGDEASRAHLHRLLFDPQAVTHLATGLERVVGGDVEGPLVGGNLAMLASSVGTGDLMPARGAIAVLEDVDETPYRLDRALTQLLRTGWFDGVRGVVLGDFTACGDAAQVRAVLLDRLRPLGVPIAAGAPIGHGAPNIAFPLGAPAALAAGALILTPWA